jgi:hypothetical protein
LKFSARAPILSDIQMTTSGSQWRHTARMCGCACAVAGTIGVLAAATTWADTRPTVVIHIEEQATIQGLRLAEARRQVTRIFAAQAVRLLWSPGKAATARVAQTGRQVTIVIASGLVAERMLPAQGRRVVLGRAVHSIDRIYIHYDRVEAVARSQGASTGRFLGEVMAHELGHLLMPGAAHAERGIMAAVLDPMSRHPPSFSDDQGSTMRIELEVAERGRVSVIDER